MSDRRERCGDCYFFDVTDGQAGGACRRYPPRMVTPASPSWARVREEDWCGEYRAAHERDEAPVRITVPPAAMPALAGSSAMNVGAVAQVQRVPEPPAEELPHDTEFEGDEGDQSDDEPDEAQDRTNPERKPKKKKKGKR